MDVASVFFESDGNSFRTICTEIRGYKKKAKTHTHKKMFIDENPAFTLPGHRAIGDRSFSTSNFSYSSK